MFKPAPLRPQGFLNATRAAPLLRPSETSFNPPSAAAKSMVAALRSAGIKNDAVLSAMLAVPRHVFVDAIFAPRAYENVALPIAYGQTISQPWIVARMIALALEAPAIGEKTKRRWLEIGTGCGYQAAVMAHCADQVCSIERIVGLHQAAQQHLKLVGLPNVQLLHSDGSTGWPHTTDATGFNAIIVAAAGIDIAPAWLHQLAIGGRLVAPVGPTHGGQALHLVDRISINEWRRTVLESVQFVPLLAGTMI